ncbi:MAG: acetate--CoA ligase family protein [Geobacter sp.]|nr:acetate--CoA ligase family protein [Geobacter sp.]
MTITNHLHKFLATHEGESSFLEHEVKGFLRDLNVPVPAGVFIPTGGRLHDPLPLDFPLVVKVAGRKITGKSDVGGVRLAITDSQELGRAIAELSAISGAEGVLVEEQARPGVEVIVGGAIDPQFGPVVMFGLGGVLVELFRDVAFALAPLKPEEARGLIARTKGSRLLMGYRGKPAVDMEALASVVVTVSELIGSGLLEEIDLNPLVLYPDGALALDAKMKRKCIKE